MSENKKKFFKRYSRSDHKPPTSEQPSITFDWKPERICDLSEFIRKQEKLSSVIELKFKFYGTMITTFKHIKFPVPTMSSLLNDERDIINEKFKQRRKAHWKKTEEYNDNYHAVWAYIWEMCTEALKAKLREFSHFEANYITKDPLILWQDIKLIYDGVDADSGKKDEASACRDY
jgi:hypothetical protein